MTVVEKTSADVIQSRELHGSLAAMKPLGNRHGQVLRCTTRRRLSERTTKCIRKSCIFLATIVHSTCNAVDRLVVSVLVVLYTGRHSGIRCSSA